MGCGHSAPAARDGSADGGARGPGAKGGDPAARNPVQSPKHKAKHTRGPLDQQELAAKHELADGYEQASGSPDIGSAVSQQGDLEANEDKWDDRVKKERRLGFGMEVVREQLRRMAVGGPQTEADRAKIYEVSSSDNSDNDGQELERSITLSRNEVVWKPENTVSTICGALKDNQVFHGMADSLVQMVRHTPSRQICR
ncbi:unnamed protein product [Ostreobium quekettii]|uniref:Uncharacterized protein n=1 Tax=Ostreobium quekettii TaxID=121088 RepID=A0A8S1JBA8_9CHLO|nr:unnamed protein product [Ostreobium quekettii]